MVKTFNTQHNMKRDDIIFDIIEKENQRQRKGIELIASENFVSDQVMQAMGSCLTNKYAEGYPGKRYYGGCEVVDQSEQVAIDRIKKLFNAEWANVQPHSGAQANMAVFMAVLNPDDKFLELNLSHGGHLHHLMKGPDPTLADSLLQQGLVRRGRLRHHGQQQPKQRQGSIHG